MSRDSEYLAYVAGFFDGEGCVGVYGNGSHGGPRLRVQAFQNHSPAADQMMTGLRERWGGSLIARQRGWLYSSCGANSHRFLVDVLPFLRIKREQAQLAIDWQESRPAPRQQGVDGKFLPYPASRKWFDEAVAARLVELKNKKRDAA